MALEPAREPTAPYYRIFLLTVWQESLPLNDSAPDWRFRVEDARTGQRWGFASVQALTKALCTGLPDQNRHEDAK